MPYSSSASDPLLTDHEWEQLARFVAGELDGASADMWRTRASADPALASLLDRLRRSTPRAAVDVERALASVHARMAEPHVLPLPVRSGRRNLWRAVAAIAAVATFAVLWPRGTDAPTPATAAIVASSAVGARDSLLLADGSRVILGPSSTLRVPADYATNRRVELQGEGYFEVRHDDAHPFAVHTANALITDIGTVFAVRSDPDDGIAVSVQEGVVRVGVDGRSGGAELRAGDAGTVAASGSVTALRKSATRDDIAWTTGKLMFREATMARVRDDLKRWYGVTVLVQDRVLAGRRLTANFQRENRAQMLDVLTLALGARKTVHGDTVVLSGLR